MDALPKLYEMKDRDNQRQPVVSIGMPVTNGEAFLTKTLEAVLDQTFQDFEIILSDNASTDCTQAICEWYAERDVRIRYYRYDEPLSAAGIYNRVVELARGVYFKWAAYDDLLEPEFLQQCVDVLDREAGVVLCYPRTRLIDENDNCFGVYADDLNLRMPHPHQRYRQFFGNEGLCHPVFGLIRTDALKRTALMGDHTDADRGLVAELSLLGELCEIPDYLFSRRIHCGESAGVQTRSNEISFYYDLRSKNSDLGYSFNRLMRQLHSIRRAHLGLFESVICSLLAARHTLLADPGKG
jgi:glycosyltransferase involved in cell wall biosynthesis